MVPHTFLVAALITGADPALASDVEVLSQPQERPKIRLELRNHRPNRPMELVRVGGESEGTASSVMGDTYHLHVATYESVCEIPCTLRVAPIGSPLLLRSVPGSKPAPPVWLNEKYLGVGRDVTYDVYPGNILTRALGWGTLGLGGSLLLSSVPLAMMRRNLDIGLDREPRPLWVMALPLLAVGAAATGGGLALINVGSTKMKSSR
ncbi:MAG: hypothetical protein EA397_12755 [Deltaproteobacteria bacterium]|nr:MAG: hypothetical protein EA397_12755 [Deltaproteobacteria bacterium]